MNFHHGKPDQRMHFFMAAKQECELCVQRRSCSQTADSVKRACTSLCHRHTYLQASPPQLCKFKCSSEILASGATTLPRPQVAHSQILHCCPEIMPLALTQHANLLRALEGSQTLRTCPRFQRGPAGSSAAARRWACTQSFRTMAAPLRPWERTPTVSTRVWGSWCVV